MTRPLLTICALLFVAHLYSQPNRFKHPTTLGVHFFLNDFKNNSFFGTASRMDAGLSLVYLKGISPYFDYSLNISASFPDSVSKHIVSNEKSLLLQGDLSIRARILGKPNWINPYFQSGFGVGRYKTNSLAYVSVGPGIELNYKDVYFNTTFQYRPSLTKKLNNHYFYSIGISGFIGKKEKKKTVSNAPTIKESVIARDSDGDGILDSSDACPAIPGLAKYKGCPMPDRDKDGISDEEDKCPDIAGLLRYQGCPIPDTDRDGINDEQDSCINVPGVRENHGCPIIKKEIKEKIDLAAKNIFFKTGSSELLEKSFMSLDQIVSILRDNPSLALSIEGHTDNVGASNKNQILSENRANAVMQYLVTKGINANRLTTSGYGETKPVDINTTSEGRAKNRRVELKLSFQSLKDNN